MHYFKCPYHKWAFMACRKPLDDDTSSARPMTNDLVTNIVGHGRVCVMCDDCHIYHQVYMPTLPRYIFKTLTCRIQVAYFIMLKEMTLYIGPMSPIFHFYSKRKCNKPKAFIQPNIEHFWIS